MLGCKYYIKEITNPKLAEKDPGLREGDIVLRINGQALDGVTLEEASRWLQRSREKLSLVVQRDVRRGSTGSRWPSQQTVIMLNREESLNFRFMNALAVSQPPQGIAQHQCIMGKQPTR